MKPKTREMLLNFANAVEELANGAVHMIGVESAGRIISASEDLKKALDEEQPNVGIVSNKSPVDLSGTGRFA